MWQKFKSSWQVFWGLPLLFFIVFFILDQWTKIEIVNLYKDDGKVFYPVIDGFLNIVYVTNKGAAWGILNNYTGFLAIISFLFGFYMLINFKDLVGNNRFYRLLGGLMLAGVWGNFIDRGFRSVGVIDMIDVVFWGWHYPTFNIADACICVSIACYLFCVTFLERKQKNVSNYKEDN